MVVRSDYIFNNWVGLCVWNPAKNQSKFPSLGVLTLLNIKNKFEMNGDKFLIDTNIIIYLTQKKLKIDDFAKNEDRLYISSITYIETLGYPFLDQDEEKIIIS